MVDPDLVTIFAGIFAVSVGYPLARAVANRMEQRAITREDSAEFRKRLEAIENAIDTIAVEVERMSEAQRFTARLLSERTLAQEPPRIAPLRPAESITPH